MIQTIGFSLLSAGVFRGDQSLAAVLAIGVKAIRDWSRDHSTNPNSKLEEILLFAFTDLEVRTLLRVCDRLLLPKTHTKANAKTNAKTNTCAEDVTSSSPQNANEATNMADRNNNNNKDVVTVSPKSEQAAEKNTEETSTTTTTATENSKVVPEASESPNTKSSADVDANKKTEKETGLTEDKVMTDVEDNSGGEDSPNNNNNKKTDTMANTALAVAISEDDKVMTDAEESLRAAALAMCGDKVMTDAEESSNEQKPSPKRKAADEGAATTDTPSISIHTTDKQESSKKEDA